METLGGFVADPRGALKRLAARRELGAAVAVIALVAVGRVLADGLSNGLSPDRALRAGARAIGSSLALWLVAAASWHGAARLAGRQGSFKSLLTVLGWSAAVYGLALPAALTARWVSLPGWAAGGAQLAVELAFLALVWWSLRQVYGWSGGAAALVLAAPPLVIFLLAAAAGIFLTASFIGGAVFSKVLL